MVLDIIGSSGFGYEFTALRSVSIGSSSNSEEKSGSGLADARTTIFNTGSPSRIVANLSTIFPPATSTHSG